MKKRIFYSFVSLTVVFSLLLFRIGLLGSNQELTAVGQGMSTRSVVVTSLRGTIYDRNHQPLVNTGTQYKAALLPEKQLLQRVQSVMDVSQYQALLKSAQSGVPKVVNLLEPAAIAPGLRVFKTPTRYTDYCPCPHIVGHLNGDETSGVSGIELAYDSLLSQCTGQIKATFKVDGLGEYLENTTISVTDNTDRANGGVVLTVDRELQQFVDSVSTQYLKRGAVLITDPNTGEILAASSFPTYRPDNVYASLNSEDSALLNRLTAGYDCGSVLKIITAAAALETGVLPDQIYNCSGSITVQGTTFHCHHRLGHQTLNMKQAFAQSCNLYFIQLAAQIGPVKIVEMAQRFGLLEEITLASSLVASAAVMPNVTELLSPAALANLSIGQGKLLVSPMHIAQMTAVVACNGTRMPLILVSGTLTSDGTLSEVVGGEGETILSAATVSTIKEMMCLVVTEGTGQGAYTDQITAAAKTGTAQTGQISEDGDVIQSWITGFISAEEPEYVITILAEDAETTHADTQGLFCEISNKITEIKRNRP
ncbi:MAG: penicillin-binding protein 2 [Clostridia bacterium]|nr:penicillin-binding protein 2 [Clostridia bacterium]